MKICLKYKTEHKVGDQLIEYSNDPDNCTEWVIWRIEKISDSGRYTCRCIEDRFDDGENLNTTVHFHHKHYRDWVYAGSMNDYNPTHFDEDLFNV